MKPIMILKANSPEFMKSVFLYKSSKASKRTSSTLHGSPVVF